MTGELSVTDVREGFLDRLEQMPDRLTLTTGRQSIGPLGKASAPVGLEGGSRAR